MEATVVPSEIRYESEVAEKAMLAEQFADETSAVLACPDCGGDLTRVAPLTCRCRLGHAYGSTSLLESQHDQLEQTLWAAMRILSDRRRVLENLVEDYRTKNRHHLVESTAAYAGELDRDFQVLRSVLTSLGDTGGINAEGT